MKVKDFAPVLKPENAFTKSELLEEIRNGMQGIGQLIDALHGKRGTNLDKEGVEERLRSARMCRIGAVIYDYALEGIWPDAKVAGEDHIDEVFLDFTAYCWAARNAAELYNTEAPCRAEKMIAMAFCRAGLDYQTIGISPDVVIFEDAPNKFTLFEVAVLAQMNEKSVRNATQPSSNDRLQTIKVGTRTVVEAHEALRWLKKRRSFNVTVKSVCLA